MIGARLRHERGWSDARILNLSSRGMLVRSSPAPARGAYVEICKGSHRIVARVVWAEQDRFGAQAQDTISVGAIAAGEDPPPVAASGNGDRRRRPRQEGPADRHDRSRQASRRMEFACVTLFAFTAAFFAFDTVKETLAKPLGLVEATLGAKG
jgi:hypothetical protein